MKVNVQYYRTPMKYQKYRYYFELLFSFIFGLNFHIFQQILGLRHLDDGVDYYEEVHHTFQNKICHTIGMPVTMFGAYLWIPALLFGEIYKGRIDINGEFYLYSFSEHFRNCFMLFYIGVYLQINILNTILVISWYYISYDLSMIVYKKLNRIQNFIVGLTIMTGALLFQEGIGHSFGNDPPSRIAFLPIFNAIIYAPYFSVSHLLEY